MPLVEYLDTTTSRIATKTAVAFLLLFYTSSLMANESIELSNSCSYFGEVLPSSAYLFSSDKEAEKIIDEVLLASGLPKNFKVRAAGVPNASAVIIGNDRYVLYNQNFVRTLKEASNSDWTAYMVMAHEIGHHLAGHTLSSAGSRPSIELEADKFAGFTLQKLGAALPDSTVGIKILAPIEASLTHPARHDRVAAISSGWISACDLDQSCESSISHISELSTTPKEQKTFAKPNMSSQLNSTNLAKYETTIFETKHLIKDIQMTLNQYGCEAGVVDGVWGPGTEKALNRYINAAEPIGRNGIRHLTQQLNTQQKRSLEAQTAKTFMSGHLKRLSYARRIRDNVGLFGKYLLKNGRYECFGRPPAYTTKMKQQERR